MIHFEKFKLDNGLTVIVHEDKSTPLAAINILYDVGAKDEDPGRTGFAHLFEHLMFGGSVNIPRYDEALEKAGGENNAFTNNDITNYYLTLPAGNIETGFWLESDRMLSLAFSEKSLEVQRHVVIEEFNERYLNQPYGDVWLLLRPLAYKVHPYRWNTIGKEISHIAEAKLQDVKDFFARFYFPANAIMVVAGNVRTAEIKKLAEKWFGPIPSGSKEKRILPSEPEQKEKRIMSVSRDVPANALYKAYHTGPRTASLFYAEDLLTDILAEGKSSRLYNSLVKDKKLFSEIDLYLSGDVEPGLVVAEGKLHKGIPMEQAEAALQEELNRVCKEYVTEEEIEKVKNKMEAALLFSEVNVLNKAMNLAFWELLGGASLANKEIDFYRSVTREQIRERASGIFNESNSSTLYYLAEKQGGKPAIPA